MRIGIDLMGSDTPSHSLFEAVLQALENSPSNVTFVLFVSPRDIPSKKYARIEIVLVESFIGMDEDPLSAVRIKKESSIVVAIKYLKDKKIDALVTAGSTGALIVGAALYLPLFEGIDRPTLLALFPTLKGPMAVLDVGGTTSYKAQHLVQYAHMGVAYQKCSKGIEKPAIGLMNIGVESKKGTPEIREAYHILSADTTLNFLGNVEARDVFKGHVDVLVTDGFTGNVFLKTAEGISDFILERVQEVIPENGTLKNLRQQFSQEEQPGGVLCGVDGVVIKCHGSTTPKAMLRSIERAIVLLQNQLIPQMKKELSI